MTPSTSDKIMIFVRELRINLCVGIFDHEFQKSQPVVISIECEGLADQNYADIKEKDLSRVMNYKPIYHFLHDELPTLGHIFLLETAAERVLDFCFRDPRIKTAKVRIEKTAIFPDVAGVGVEIVRRRP